MNILITAGGTSEKIDQVRVLTNQATGRLGKEIADVFKHDNVHIYYVHGPQAVLPTGDNVELIPIHSVKELYTQMETLLTTKSIDYVIHSMAVSDYQANQALSDDILARTLAQNLIHLPDLSEDELTNVIQQLLHNPNSFPDQTAKKISSKGEQLILILDKAPKIIQHIKKWQPNTTLIGFKLLVGVSEEELVQVAKESIVKNQADFILANDLENITNEQHIGLLVNNTGIKQRFTTKKDIAQGIKQLIIEK